MDVLSVTDQERIEALEAHIAKLEQWDSMSMREWCELQYGYELLVNEVVSELEGLRRGVAITYVGGRDPVKELRHRLASVDQILACRDALRHLNGSPVDGKGEQ